MMNTPSRVVVGATLVCVGMVGCQPAAKDAAKDTTAIQVKAPVESVTTPVAPAPAPVVATKPLAQPTAKAPIKETGVAKIAPRPTNANDAASAAAARADSIKQAQAQAQSQAQAQARADAITSARLDSVKKAEAARVAVKTEPVAPAAAPAAAGQAADGKTPYEENCRKCHGVRGIPPKTMKDKFPKIATFDADFFAKHSADSIVTVLTKGKNDDMKSFKDKLTHSEMVAVAAYIRSFVH